MNHLFMRICPMLPLITFVLKPVFSKSWFGISDYIKFQIAIFSPTSNSLNMNNIRFNAELWDGGKSLGLDLALIYKIYILMEIYIYIYRQSAISGLVIFETFLWVKNLKHISEAYHVYTYITPQPCHNFLFLQHMYGAYIVWGIYIHISNTYGAYIVYL